MSQRHGQTPKCESSDVTPQEVYKEIRVEDKLRLRELELQTNFQIQTLSESLALLKNDFHSWRDSFRAEMEQDRAEMKEVKAEVKESHKELISLKARLTVVLVIALAQLSGLDLTWAMGALR